MDLALVGPSVIERFTEMINQYFEDYQKNNAAAIQAMRDDYEDFDYEQTEVLEKFLDGALHKFDLALKVFEDSKTQNFWVPIQIDLEDSLRDLKMAVLQIEKLMNKRETPHAVNNNDINAMCYIMNDWSDKLHEIKPKLPKYTSYEDVINKSMDNAKRYLDQCYSDFRKNGIRKRKAAASPSVSSSKKIKM